MPAVYAPPRAATPCHTVQKPHPTPKVEPSRRWDVVPPVLEINGSNCDVSASSITCLGSHPHLGSPHQTRCGLQPPATSSTPKFGGVVHAGLGRGFLSIQELQVYHQRLCITKHIVWSHAHIGTLRTAHRHPQPPDLIANPGLERHKLGALTWLLCEIQALRWVPARRGITCNIWR